MFSFKKKSENAQPNLRRRFHHWLIERRKGKSQEKLPKQLPKKSTQQKRPPAGANKRLKITMLFIIICGILLGSFYIIFFSSFLVITKVNIEKNGNAVALSSLSQFLEKLKGKNILFISTSTLERNIEQTFKNEVLLTEIKKSYPNRVTIKIEEYPAVLNLKIISDSKTQIFVLNQIGYAILENSEQKNLPTLILKTQKPVESKTSLLIDNEKLKIIAEAFQKFAQIFGMKIVEGEWRKTERELHLKTEKNFSIWLDLTQNVENQLLKLRRALVKLDIYNTPLEYIDLRIAGGENEKVIYKKK